MQPHSEAKVALYARYLEKYLAILGVVDFITKINVYDVFCGTGIYRNGKFGSPIVAYNAIIKTRDFLKTISRTGKSTSLIINDGNATSVSNVDSYLSTLNAKDPCCNMSFYNLDAKEMFDKIIADLKLQDNSVRNLVFIDPTGYKQIHKEDLYSLLQNRKTEVVLFLPISFMYRFKDIVQADFDNPSYEHLRRFIYDFFDEAHPVRKNENIDVFRFMDYLKDALRFDNKFYSTYFFLQRSSNNYYALFFITSNILGLERTIDAKWTIDEQRGQGFVYEDTVETGQLAIFPKSKPTILKSRLEDLENILLDFITNHPNCNNCDLYELVLLNDFKPTHATQILKKWQNEPVIKVWDKEKKKEAQKGSFYLSSKYCKNKDGRVTFKKI